MLNTHQATSAHIAVPPRYIRMPRWGERCPHSGLTRSAIDSLVRSQQSNKFHPPVVSKIMRQTGAGKGVRLIDYQSLMDYLAALPDGTAEQEGSGLNAVSR